ncbi:hypothetical protein PCASD_00146 [Puccinia coronata f. sp. avenae]|uniref:Uncharacterized protein n=1 Tax=Puccinia coronata f. sp. avenae TaxID=200324 RepID=A0A2N5VQK0_9BASI|nr:hypothetical protein PCASD_00146 [Puccinia coronata f. sp. avenae]
MDGVPYQFGSDQHHNFEYSVQRLDFPNQYCGINDDYMHHQGYPHNFGSQDLTSYNNMDSYAFHEPINTQITQPNNTPATQPAHTPTPRSNNAPSTAAQNCLIPPVASNQNIGAPTHIRNILNPLPLQSQPLSSRSTSMENGIALTPLVRVEDTVLPKNTENSQPFNNTSNTSSAAIPGFAPSSTIAPAAPSSAIAPAAPSSAIAPAAPSSTIAPAAPLSSIAPAAPSSTIAPAAPPATMPAESTRPSDKFRLSPEEMAEYAKLPTQKLRALQATHIRYHKLTEEVKQAAEDLYLEYHQKILLLSLEYSRPATAIGIHVGQGRMRRDNAWNDYLANSEEAHQSFQSSAELQLSKQNQLAAAGYRQAKSSAAGVALPATQSKVLTDVFTRRKTLPSQKKMMEDVEEWKLSVQRQLKEMSNSMQIEGFLVLASQDHTRNFFWQGGSFLGQQYL